VTAGDDTAARLTVDLDAVAANHAALKAAAGSPVAPVVKGEAYGVGMVPVAERLWAEGAREFFVARVGEGERLRQAFGDRAAAIYVLDGCPPGASGRLSAAALVPVLNSSAQIEAWRGAGGGPAALHVDTGMNRLGLRVAEAEALVETGDPQGISSGISLVISHLACGGTPDHPMNAAQADAFDRVRRLFPSARASLANTAGCFLGPRFRHDLARPGVGLVGGGPFEASHPAIQPVATLEAPILQVRTVRAGETVGYGATFTATETLDVAILAAGFADGVLRALGAGGYGWFEGRARPFLGRISMDLIALDVTGCEAARPGAWVELLGEHVPLDEVARRAGTVPYEILTRPAHRIARLYRGRA
jgi:alanine racemase